MAQMEKITGGRTTGEKVKTGILGFFHFESMKKIL